MKRNFLSILAIALTIGISSFTVAKTTTFYYNYTASGTGAHTDINSYASPVTTPLSAQSGDDVLAWVAITDADNNVTSTEFTTAVNTLDRSNPKNGSLNDAVDQETTIGNYQLERKF
jgi:hypothetical protein